MDLTYENYLERAQNEINLSEIVMELSLNPNSQTTFKVTKVDTYFSSVISHAYYAIFYSAKAYLLKKGIKTTVPNEHKKTFKAFKRFVKEGTIDKELLKIYEDIIIKAETLLGIFKDEKKNRGEFTYQKLAQANKEPARNSLENTKTFFRHINELCHKT